MNFLRNKPVMSLVVFVVLGVLIGLAHNVELTSGRPFFVQDAVRTMLAPVDWVMHSVLSSGGRLKLVFRPRSSILKENARLREKVRELTAENSRLREAAHENVSLRRSLRLKESTPLKMQAAEIISRNASSWFDTATLGIGVKAGIKKGAAVINHLGLIGQVTDVDPITCQMVALTDPSSAVGGMVQRSRSVGVVQGQGDAYLVLAYLPKDADVKIGDLIVSSGKGKVVPKGLPVGRVVRVVRNSLAGTTSAVVEPSVKFSKIEHVFVAELGQTGIGQ